MLKFLKPVLDAFLPSACVLCSGPALTEIALCRTCVELFSNSRDICASCGVAMADNNASCGNCLKTPPKYQAMLSGCDYTFPADYCISQLKFAQQFIMADILAWLLYNEVSKHYDPGTGPDRIIPVPLHATRLRQRGYNQAELIARRLSKRFNFNIAVDVKSCRRTKATQAQAGLNASQRRRNLSQAFASDANLSGLHIALLDDVVTTTSTCKALTEICLARGAKRVDIWSASRVR